jgi:hypothetical protein
MRPPPNFPAVSLDNPAAKDETWVLVTAGLDGTLVSDCGFDVISIFGHLLKRLKQAGRFACSTRN